MKILLFQLFSHLRLQFRILMRDFWYFFSLGGLDLSRQFEKVDLDGMDNLDTLKKLVLTLRTFSTVQKPSLDSLDYSKNWDFSIFVEISIESLDLDMMDNLDTLKKLV